MRPSAVTGYCRAANALTGLAFALYLAATWPGRDEVRTAALTLFVLTAVLGYVPWLMRPLIEEEAERVGSLIARELSEQLGDWATATASRQRREADASAALRARLIPEQASVSSTAVRSLRPAGEGD